MSIFDRKRNDSHDNSVQKCSRNSIGHVRARVNPNTNKIPYVPARVNHDSIPETRKQDGRLFGKKIAHVHKIVTGIGIGEGKGKSAEMKIPEPLTHFPKQTAIYKLFNKKYWKGRVIRFDPKRDYYTVQYDDNDEEELTHEEVKAYLIPPVQGDYWTAKQSG